MYFHPQKLSKRRVAELIPQFHFGPVVAIHITDQYDKLFTIFFTLLQTRGREKGKRERDSHSMCCPWDALVSFLKNGCLQNPTPTNSPLCFFDEKFPPVIFFRFLLQPLHLSYQVWKKFFSRLDLSLKLNNNSRL